MNTNLKQMLLDILTGNPSWTELIDVLDNFNDTQVMPNIQKLLDIRNMETADDLVIEESLRQLGVNMGKDVLKNNIKSISTLFDSVGKYNQVQGTTDWYKYVSFLIGSLFNGRRLWTSDYKTFSELPQGKTILDGGNWYPSTKVNLDIGIDMLDASKLDLRIAAKHHDVIVELLQTLWISDSNRHMSEAEAEYWFQKSIGLEPRNNDPIQRSVRVLLLLDRMTELFYQWSPVEEILEGIWITIEAQTTIYTSCSVVLEPMRYVSIGHALPKTTETFMTVKSAGLDYVDQAAVRPQMFSYGPLTSYQAGGLTRSGSRSYNVMILDSVTGAVVDYQKFDVYGDSSKVVANTCAAFIDQQTPDKIIIVSTWDEPQTNLKGSNLYNSLVSIGGTSQILGALKYRSAYILVGKTGLGEGQGIERYNGRVDNDTGSYTELVLDIANLDLKGLPKVSPTLSSFVYPKNVRASRYIYVSYKETFSDNTEIMHQATIEAAPYITEQGTGYLMFAEPNSVTQHQVVLSYGGIKETVTFNVTPSDYITDPVDIALELPEIVYGGSRIQMRVLAAYVGSSNYEMLSDTTLLTFESSLGIVDGLDLILPDTKYDLPFSVTAKYSGVGNTLTDTVVVNAKKSITEVVPTHIQLVVAETINQGQNSTIGCLVTYNDGTTKEVQPAYTLSTKKVTIQNSVLVGDFTKFDYMCTIHASYMENGVIVTTSETISLVSKKYRLYDVKIETLSTVAESSVVQPTAYGYYVLDSATGADIAAGINVLGWYSISGSWSGTSRQGTVNAMPSVNSSTGMYTAPLVSADSDFGIRFSTTYGQQVFTVDKTIRVYDTVLSPIGLEIITSDNIYSGNSSSVNFSATWNNGRSYNADVELTAEFIPSESGKAEAKARTLKLIADGVQFQSDGLTPLDPEAPEYGNWVSLYIEDTAIIKKDPMLNSDYKVQNIYFYGDLHGQCKLTASYTGGVLQSPVVAYREVALVPRRSIVTDLKIECVEAVAEQSRTFARAKATYSDGTSEWVQPEWSADWPDYESDPYTLVKFTPSTYSGLEIVKLCAQTPATYEAFQAMSISRWAMFDGITSLEQLEELQVLGTIINTKKVNSTTYASIKARYYRVSDKVDLLVTDRLRDPINTIVASRILGPTSFSAGSDYISYALVNTYQLTGVQHNLDGTYFEGPARQFDLQVSNDWAIVYTYYQDADGNYSIPTDDIVATIDGDGYVWPVLNVNARLVIRATFNDGYNAFTREAEVIIEMYNKYLLDMYITGLDVVSDRESDNAGVGYESGNGVWYIPYSAFLQSGTSDAEYKTPAPLTWSLQSPLSLSNIRIDEEKGHLVVGEQDADATITVVAKYSEDTPDGNYRETIYARRDVAIKSSKAITDVYIEQPLQNLDPETNIPLKAIYTRRNNLSYDNLSPDPNTGVSYTWSLEETALDGITLSTKGVLKFPSRNISQTIQVTVVVKEGRTVVSDTIQLTCPAIGYPVALIVNGFQNIRDDSVVKYNSEVDRYAKTLNDDVTTSSHWTMQNEAGDTIAIRNVSLDPASGILTAQKIRDDVEFYVNCYYLENEAAFNTRVKVTVRSSYPKIGVGRFGISDLAGADQYLVEKVLTSGPAAFTLNATGDNFGYYLVRSDYGIPTFTAVADNNGLINLNYGGWDGANRPVGGGSQTGYIELQRVYDNVVDRLRLYRTNEKGFLLTVFTVRYS